MKLTEDMTETLMKMGLKELWSHFRLLKGEYDEYESDYKKVRWGDKIGITMKDINEKNFTEKGKTREISYFDTKIGKAARVDVDDFDTEIMEREDTMRKAIYDNQAVLEMTAPRIGGGE